MGMHAHAMIGVGTSVRDGVEVKVKARVPREVQVAADAEVEAVIHPIHGGYRSASARPGVY